ncbi:MAG: hypothetical protein C0P61_000770, partial [Bacillota bacterium]
GIVPCGLTNRAVTSMQELLGRRVDMAEVHVALTYHFAHVFQRAVATQPADALSPWLAMAEGAASASAPAEGDPHKARPEAARQLQ